MKIEWTKISRPFVYFPEHRSLKSKDSVALSDASHLVSWRIDTTPVLLSLTCAFSQQSVLSKNVQLDLDQDSKQTTSELCSVLKCKVTNTTSHVGAACECMKVKLKVFFLYWKRL